MNRSTYRLTRFGVALLLAATVAGCGSTDSPRSSAHQASSPQPTAAPSTFPSTEPPGATAAPGSPTPAEPSLPSPREPSKAPAKQQAPTDNVDPSQLIGTITTDSSGPCYVVVNDDGEEFTLYSPDRLPLRKATRVRGTLGPAPAKPLCSGRGRHATIIGLRTLG